MLMLEEICRRNTERALAAGTQLPGWPESMRGVPNGVLRSALFGAIKRGKRGFLQRQPIASLEGVSIVYTGARLDQSDLDVWEGVLHLSRCSELGARIEFTARGLLRLIGRGGHNGESIGKSDREWLKNVLSRLKATSVEIQQGPYAYGGSLIDEYFRDDSTGRYILILNPRMKAIFSRDGWTQIDWGIRSLLRGHPLAQWLHGFYSTHASPFPLKVATLHRLCGSASGGEAQTPVQRNKAIQDWRDGSLIPALKALEIAVNRVGQSLSWDIAGGALVKVNRDPSKTQQKHLRMKLVNR